MSAPGRHIAAACTLAAALLGGCDLVGPPRVAIKDILAKPTAFEGKEVLVRGTVVSVTKLPIVPIRGYVLREDGADLSVTTDGEVPAVGDALVVKGRIESAAIIGGQSYGLALRERDRGRQ
jgi:hypothetical protein